MLLILMVTEMMMMMAMTMNMEIMMLGGPVCENVLHILDTGAPKLRF